MEDVSAAAMTSTSVDQDVEHRVSNGRSFART